MKSWGKIKAKTPSYSFQQITGHFFSTLDSQGRWCTRSRLLHKTTECTNVCGPSSYLCWTLILKTKYLVLVQIPSLSGKTWEDVPRCCTAEGRYCRRITPPHPELGKMKPEAIAEVTRNKHQDGKGPAECYRVVTIYFKKPSPTGDTGMQCSSDSTHHQTKTHQVTKPSADLCIAEQRMLYLENKLTAAA